MSTTLEDNLTHNTPNPLLFAGAMTVSLSEALGTGPTNYEVDSTLPFDVKVDWSQSGFIANVLSTIGGQWVVELVYDRIGAAGEGDVPVINPTNPKTIAAHNGSAPNSHTFHMAAGTLPTGVYSMVVLLSLKESSNTLRLAAFEEIRPIRVY